MLTLQEKHSCLFTSFAFDAAPGKSRLHLLEEERCCRLIGSAARLFK